MPPSSNIEGQLLVSGGENKSAKYIDTLSAFQGGTGLTNSTIQANKLYFFEADDTGILQDKLIAVNNSFVSQDFLAINALKPYLLEYGINTEIITSPYFLIQSETFNDEEGLYPSVMLSYGGDSDYYLDIPALDGSLVATSHATIKPTLRIHKQYSLAAFAPSLHYEIEALNAFYCDTVKLKDSETGNYTNFINLVLGDATPSVTSSTKTGTTGAITLFAQNQFSTKIQPRENITSCDYNLFLPDFISVDEDDSRQNLFLVGIKETQVTDATGTTSNILRDVGALNTPVYAKSTGELVPCKGVVVTNENQEFSGVKTFANVFTGHLRPKEIKGKSYELGQNTNPWSSIHAKTFNAYGIRRTEKISEDPIDYETALVYGGGISVGTSETLEANPNSGSLNGTFTRLYLGNSIPGETYAFNEVTQKDELVSTNPDSRYGELYFYTKGSGAIVIRPRKDSAKVNSNLVFYLPDPLNISTNAIYSVWSAQQASAIGDINHPVYMDKDGQILACDNSLGNSSNPLNSIITKEIVIWDSHENANIHSGKLYTNINNDTDCNYTTLELGNEYEKTATPELLSFLSKQGQIRLFGENENSVYIRPRPDIGVDSLFYLPSAAQSYAVWYNNQAVGDNTTPVYIDSTGQVKAANAYSSLLTTLTTSENTISTTVGGTTKSANIITSFTGNWDVPTGGVNNPKIELEVNKNPVSIVIPAAAKNTSGIVTTDDQTFSGTKSFTNDIVPVLSTTDNNNIFSEISLGTITNYWKDIFTKKITLTESSGAKSVNIKNNHTNTQNGLNIYLPSQSATTTTKTDYDIQLVWIDHGTSVGTGDNPIYITADGEVATGSLYAGGTQFTTFNGSNAISTAIVSAYAPTTGGSSGQVLISSGNNTAPTWSNQDVLNVASAVKDGNGKNISTTYATKDELTQAIDTITGDDGTDTFSTLVEIHKWMTGDGVDAKELTAAIADEAQLRQNADKGLQDTLDALSIRVTPISLGGTGTSSLTSNRIIYANTDTTSNQTFVSGNHYIDNSKIAINNTSKPTETFYVNGSSKFNGTIIGAQDQNYGGSFPTTNLTVGRIFFKLI